MEVTGMTQDRSIWAVLAVSLAATIVARVT
jgi:hypothetical protein